MFLDCPPAIYLNIEPTVQYLPLLHELNFQQIPSETHSLEFHYFQN